MSLDGWTTSDYAFFISLFSAALALFSLGWNIWSKFIYPKARLRMYGGYYVSGDEKDPTTLRLIVVSVTNHGPTDTTITTLIGRKGRWHSRITRRFDMFIINHWGKPNRHLPSIDLPVQVKVAEEVKFNFSHDVSWAKKSDMIQFGVSDVFGKHHWLPKKDQKSIQKSLEKLEQ